MARSATTTNPDVAAVAESLRLSVTRLFRILRQQDGQGLTPSTTSALAMVFHHGPLTLGELAAREHVSAPTVTRIVEKLQRDGLVERTTSTTDGRVAYVAVTERGRHLVLDLRSRRTRWLADRLNELSPAELTALEQAAPVLERLVAAAAQGGRP